MFRTVTAVFVRIGCLLASLILVSISPAAAQAPAWAWGLQSTNPTPNDYSDTYGTAIDADAAGSIYVGGRYGNTWPSVGNATRRFGATGSVGAGVGGFVAKATPSGQWAWVTDIVAVGPNIDGQMLATVSDVVVSRAGDVYVAGWVGSANVRIGGLTAAVATSGYALFVAQLSNLGVCQWIRVTESGSQFPSLAADPITGGVVLAGTYHNTLSFGNFALPTVNSSSNLGLYVARLSATGQWLGAVAAVGTSLVFNNVAVAVGPAGQVAIAGVHSQGTIMFGTTALTLASPRYEAIMVAQLSAANHWEWAVNNTGGSFCEAYDVAYTRGGALWVCGTGSDGAVVGTTTLVAPSSATYTGFAGFVGQLSATGQWGITGSLSPSGVGRATMYLLKTDGTGNAVMHGLLQGMGSTFTSSANSTVSPVVVPGFTGFVAVLSTAGQWRYVASVPQSALTNGIALYAAALDVSGNFYVTGGLKGNVTIGNSTLTGSLASSWPSEHFGDVFLAKLTNATTLPARPAFLPPPLALFPSPAHTTATLRLPAPASQQTTFALLDALGRPARTFAVPAGASEARLDLKDLPAGLYLVRGNGMSARLVVE